MAIELTDPTAANISMGYALGYLRDILQSDGVITVTEWNGAMESARLERTSDDA